MSKVTRIIRLSMHSDQDTVYIYVFRDQDHYSRSSLHLRRLEGQEWTSRGHETSHSVPGFCHLRTIGYNNSPPKTWAQELNQEQPCNW